MISTDTTLRRLPVTDGLRGLAVFVVVLFHVWPRSFTGGFVGVDIFFAISGFVIARRYLTPLAEGAETFRSFFLRRIQRLVPAYLALLLLVTAAAFLLLKPLHLMHYGWSLAAQGAYLQNVWFWSQGVYFDEAAHKPLLHTWSLGVEEQFYVLFPLLALLWRRSRRRGLLLLVAAGLGSAAAGLLVSQWSLNTAFYWLPTRMWELIAGIGAALLFERFRPGRSATPLFAIGLIMIAAACAGGVPESFPGWQVGLAVGGAILLCLTQEEAAPALRRLLDNRLARHFGRISYSWYLWHWPVVSFYFVVTERMPKLGTGLACMAAGYVLALGSHYLVEGPALRSARLGTPRAGFALLGLFLGFALAAGAYLILSKGALHRYPPETARLHEAQMDRAGYRCPVLERLRLWDAEVCRLAEGKGPAILLVGDSHADVVKEVLADRARAAGRALYLVKRSCKPSDFGIQSGCSEEVWEGVRADIRRFGIGTLVAVGYWGKRQDEAALDAGTARLIGTGARVFLQKVVPNGPYFDPGLRAEGRANVPESYTAADHGRDHAERDQVFARQAARHPGRLAILDPAPWICPKGPCDFATGGRPNYHDQHHLTPAGARRIAPMYEPLFAAP